MASIRCGNCGKYHFSSEMVRDCYIKSRHETHAALRKAHEPMATANQINYAQMLFRTKQPLPSFADLDQKEAELQINKMSRHEISFFIQQMQKLPDKNRGITEGIYTYGSDIYKVLKSQTSGHLYAKRWRWITKGVDGEFHLAPGMVGKLSLEDRMPLEEAKKFGQLYGICCVCGRVLTDEESIKNGIGPVCAGKGWWVAS